MILSLLKWSKGNNTSLLGSPERTRLGHRFGSVALYSVVFLMLLFEQQVLLKVIIENNMIQV